MGKKEGNEEIEKILWGIDLTLLSIKDIAPVNRYSHAYIDKRASV